MTTPELTIDEAAVEEFAGSLMGLFTGAAVSYLIEIGHRTRLFDVAAQGPATCDELAGRAGLQERYVGEWLGAMSCAGIFEYEPATGVFWLPVEHAACLTGDGVENLAPVALLTTMLGHHVSEVADAFRLGGGVPYSAFLPAIHEVMDALWRPMYNQLLVPAILPLAPGLADALEQGARVLEVACGSGNGLLVLAREFPESTFTGYDLDGTAIANARQRASAAGLQNVHFEQRDVAGPIGTSEFDAVLVFNAIHDQAAPDAVLRRIHESLVPGGTFLMNEPRVSSLLEDNITNPMAAFTYAVSTLHCMTVSLAEGGAGLGTAWGEQLAVQMLEEAGFGPATVHDAPGDPGNAVFVTTKAHVAYDTGSVDERPTNSGVAR